RRAAGAGRPAAATQGGPAAGAPGAGSAAAPSQADCNALREKIRSGGGFASLSDADRSRLRECRTRFRGGAFAGGFGGPGGPGGPGRSGRASGVRPGVIFVQTPSGPTPRMVLLGVNDWDYTEVVRGLEPGERVIMAAVARLQQQQQDFQNRLRERAGNGMFGGGGAPRGGRGG
ncbi:MAG: hypothetical protein IRZ00_19960, partial [Gemmatimonadetes bacterium]|nr:hypothetical protein [Gemmatimonadota bacterium]